MAYEYGEYGEDFSNHLRAYKKERERNKHLAVVATDTIEFVPGLLKYWAL